MKQKHSIKKQFAFIFIALMMGAILLCWFLNNTFLETFYIKDKQKVLLRAYATVNSALSRGAEDSREFEESLQVLRGRYNLDILVVDVDSQTIKYIGNDPEYLRTQLWDNMFLQDTTDQKDYLEETQQYRIQIKGDKRFHGENIEMWGTLDNGNLFLIRTALESIKDSVRIANRFLAYAGIAVIIASGFIIWYITRKITEPILELAVISEKMAHLDFDAKYHGKGQNEIALLGENINIMSRALEKTISELKTANNELIKDIEKKTEIDEMRKEFISNVSHELKTPIALIQGYAEGLQEGVNDDEESKNYYCSVICDEASKMNDIVKKLLTLNQLESSSNRITMERFDIVTMIQNCLQSSSILLQQKDIKVQFPNEMPIYVWGDEFKVEEVFGNYLTNAIHHCEKEREIDIHLEERGKMLRTVVFNTGEPIPEESIPHIWDKFYKVDKARTRSYGGSGIGLSIVKAVMESMNQEYGVMNCENGPAFWFELELQ